MPIFTQVLKNKGFLNLWVNQILVQLSYNALNFALIIWVFKLTSSNTAVAALLFSIYLPAVIFGLFSGVLVDLMDRKKIVTFIDIFLSVLFFSLIFFKESYPAILLIAFLVNGLGQFYAPAESSAIPLIVKKRQLLSANSIFSATLYSCFLLGFGLSGPLTHFFGINFVFGFGGFALFLGFVLATLFFPHIFAKPDEQGRKLLNALKKRKYADIKEVGLYEIFQTLHLIRGKLSVLTSIGILAGVQMVIGVLAVLFPSFLEIVLRIKATDASYVFIIPLGVGIITGGIILGRGGSRVVRRLIVLRSIVFGGLLFLAAGISPLIILPPLEYMIIGSFLLGIAMVSILVPTQTVLQENTPNQDRGKVFAVLGVVMAGLSLLPVLLAGILADVFGVNSIFIGLGVVIIVIGLLGLKPSIFFKESDLPYNIREFLGLGHWSGKN